MIQLHILYFSAVHIYLFQRNWSQSLLACCENLGLITVTRRFSVATCASAYVSEDTLFLVAQNAIKI